MIEDVRRLASTRPLEADLCIVGAGIAGLAIARELLNSTHRVIVVESGAEFGDAGANELNEGETAGLRYASTLWGRTRGFGGTSELWGGQCTPMDRFDFEPRSWVPHSGWPVRYDELLPYYRRANAVFDLPADTFDPGRASAQPYSGIDVDPERLARHVSVFSPRRYVGREMREPLRQARGTTVLLHGTATALVTEGQNGRVDHVRIQSLDGHAISVRARLFVLACGAIENARLLLASNQEEPHGLGNRHGQVGRYLQDHVIADCAVIETNRLSELVRRVEIIRAGGLRWSGKLQLAESLQARARVLTATARVVFDYEDGELVERCVRLYRALARRAPLSSISPGDLGAVMRQPFRVLSYAARHFGYPLPALFRPRNVVLSGITEQAPDADSRVTLSSERDRLGVPRARVRWQLSELERQTLSTLTRVCADEFARTGLGRLVPAPWLEHGDGDWKTQVRDILHTAGTTRMAEHPGAGVVDRDCRVFDCENLYIAGASVFPTSGHANPVLTLTALAIRLADHIKPALAS